MQRKTIGVVLVHPDTPGLDDLGGAVAMRELFPLVNQKAQEIMPPDARAFEINLLEQTPIMARGAVIRMAVAFEVVEFAAKSRSRTMIGQTPATPIESPA